MSPVRKMRPVKETLARAVLEVNGTLAPGDESQPVELHGEAWARLVWLAGEEYEAELQRAGVGELRPPSPKRLAELQCENLDRVLKAPAAPCCGSINTTFTDGGDCQACGAYVAERDTRPIPPPRKKRAKKTPEQVIAAQAEAEAKTCESCGDAGHTAKDCYFFDSGKPGAEKPAQIGGES